MNIITTARIQKRVSDLVRSSDIDNMISLQSVIEKIVAEFGEDAVEEATKQYNFMIEF